MDARMVTKMLIIKRLAESLPEDRVEKNLPAIEKTAEKIMNDLDGVIQALVGTDSTSRAPKQGRIKGLAEN
jgi:hypothetical protein